MPEPDRSLIARREALAADLKAIVGDEWVLVRESERRPYEFDGLTAYRALPLLVVLPGTTEEVQGVVRYCNEHRIKIVPRGSGSSLSGGALPLEDGVLITTARMNRVLDINPRDRTIKVQTGIQNIRVTEAVEHLGFCYMPDPSSGAIATIGGNLAENSGGVHCLKYGVTANHVLGMKAVLITGDVVDLGGDYLGVADDELNLAGVLVGSEGMLAFVTEATLRLTPKPTTARVLSLGFTTVMDASACVGAIIGQGIIPAGLEFMDRTTIDAVSSLLGETHPPEVQAILLCELDGPVVEVDERVETVETIARKGAAIEVRISSSEAERENIWRGRKSVFGAIGRITRDYYCTDGTIPRGQLPEVLSRMEDMSHKYGLRYANCFHAGDGNLHPIVMYDSATPGDLEKAEAFGADILKACVDVGGVLTGEHGVGVEKRDLMPYQFTQVDLEQQQRVKCAFDPDNLLNPGKVYPTPCQCVDFGRMHVHGGKTRFSNIPRF
ncbi:MAG: FAD-linked oxidase C-terminal domain-containing protein [Caulobacteraceae bacterium]